MNKSKNIKQLLDQKLDGHESHVRPEIWQNIASHIGTGAAASTGSFVSTWIFKALIAAASIAGISSVIYFSASQNEKVIIAADPTVELAPAAEKTAVVESPAKDDETPQEILKKETTLPSSDKIERTLPSPSDADNPTKKEILQDSKNGITDRSLKNESSQRESSATANDAASNQANSDSKNEDSALEEPITASFSIKTADPEKLRYFLFASDIGKLSYRWSINGEEKSRGSNFSIQFDDQGEYSVTLEVYDAEGNMGGTHSEIIRAFKPIRFEYPTAFSPGRNGLNDKIDFEAYCFNKEKLQTLIISDLNGNTIYQSDSEFVWDGRNPQGSICNAGTYIYYVIAIDKFGETKAKNGRIQLFRD